MARILFIDDDPFTLETMMKAVQVFGHQAILASNGQEALAKVVEEKPDLIFTDMALPDMDGLTLLKRFKELSIVSEIPVIMLSASPELDATELALAAGAKAYINKPVRLQALLDLIQEYTTS